MNAVRNNLLVNFKVYMITFAKNTSYSLLKFAYVLLEKYGKLDFFNEIRLRLSFIDPVDFVKTQTESSYKQIIRR